MPQGRESQLPTYIKHVRWQLMIIFTVDYSNNYFLDWPIVLQNITEISQTLHLLYVFANVHFCPNNSPKPKDTLFTITLER